MTYVDNPFEGGIKQPTPKPLVDETELRKRLKEIVNEIEGCPGGEHLFSHLDDLETLITSDKQRLLNKARCEGKIDAAIQLDPYIDPEFRQQYEYIFGTYEEKLAQLDNSVIQNKLEGLS
jgi:hypothetical protein